MLKAAAFVRRCIPEPIAERSHTQPPLVLSLVWFVSLLVVVGGACFAASSSTTTADDNNNYDNGYNGEDANNNTTPTGVVSVPLLVFLLLCFLFSLVALVLEIFLYYKIKAIKSEPTAPQSYMEMTNTEMRIRSDDPIRRDALNYDIQALENKRQQFESAQARMEYIDESGLLQLDKYSFQVFFPTAISVGLVLLIRLLAVDHFATAPIQLDFGPKYDGSEDNIAFEHGGDENSYGHWIQGVLAGILSFPAVNGTLTVGIQRIRRVIPIHSKNALLFFDVVQACMTIYSSYNFIKRMARSADVFATSSFSDNALEWLIGVAVGVSMGVCFTSLYKYYTLVTNPDYQISMQMKTDTGSLSTNDKIILWGVRTPKGLLLLMTSFSSGLMIALSWNNCENNSDECINYSANNPSGGLIAGMLLIPMAVSLLFKVYYYYRGTPEE